MREKSSLNWLLISITVLLFFFSYGNQLIYHYSVPPGNDPLVHNSIVQEILKGHYQVLYQYHTVWHVIVAFISRFFHLESLLVMAWLGPLLLVTMGLSLYAFNRRYFGYTAGVSTLILMGFFSLQPLQTLNDGGFPNMLAAGTILPALFTVLDDAIATKHKAGPILLTLLGFVLLAFSHHLTILYTLAITFIFFLTLLFRLGRKKHISSILLLVGALLIVALGIFTLKLFLDSSLSGSVKALASEFVRVNGIWPFVHFIGTPDGPDALWPWPLYVRDIGQAVVILGLAGWLQSFAIIFTDVTNPNWRIHTLLVIWTCILFIGSRIPNLGDPGRLARDMAIPLTLLGGMVISSIYNFIHQRRGPNWLFAIILIACLINGAPVFIRRWHDIFRPNPLVAHLPVDQSAAQYIEHNLPSDARIMAFQEDRYLDYFTPTHPVSWLDEPKKVAKVVTYTKPMSVLDSYDYFYLEERYNKPRGFLNNPDITKNYLSSPYTQLVISYEQPEKKVYLFKVLHQDKKYNLSSS